MRIELVDVSYRSSHGALVSGVNLCLESPSVAVIFGPTAAGKSLLHGLVLGHVMPTSGEVLIDGESLTSLSSRRVRSLRQRLGTICAPVFHEDLNLFDNTLLAGAARGMDRESALSMALELLADVGLSHRRTSMPSELSSGERLQAAVASALMGPVEAILVDDPFSSMDEASFRSLFDVLTTYVTRRELGLLITTSDPLLADLLPGCARHELRDGVLSPLTEVA